MAGNYSLSPHWAAFIEDQVKSGLFNNVDEVLDDALRQAELRYLKLKALREHIDHAIKGSGSYTDDDIATILANDVE